MKQNGTMWNMTDSEGKPFRIDEIGDAHLSSAIEIPLREDAFELDDETKMELIEKHFREIMQIMGLDLTDDSLSGTPRRVAKMYVKEIFQGLNPKNKPAITLFENNYNFDEMVVVKDISFYSMCEHHFMPFFGKAHVAYVPKDKVVGLSKINRLVQYLARRPQVQERLTMQVANEIREAFGTEDAAVIIESHHLCVLARGVEDTHSSTITAKYSGRFENEDFKKQFISFVKSPDAVK